MVKIRFEGRDLANCDFWTKSDPYLLITRPPRAGKGFINVRRTETVRNSLNPKWSLIYISLSELCDGDYDLPLHLEVFDEDRNSRDDFIGSVQVTLHQLMKYSEAGTVVTLKKGSKNRGELLVRECSAVEDNTALIRKMSATSYPARKHSSTGQHFNNQPPAERPEYCAIPETGQSPNYSAAGPPAFHQPQPQPHYPHHQPQYHQPPQYPHHQPLTASASLPVYPQHQFQGEDPTDTRPTSIWI